MGTRRAVGYECERLCPTHSHANRGRFQSRLVSSRDSNDRQLGYDSESVMGSVQNCPVPNRDLNAHRSGYEPESEIVSVQDRLVSKQDVNSHRKRLRRRRESARRVLCRAAPHNPIGGKLVRDHLLQLPYGGSWGEGFLMPHLSGRRPGNMVVGCNPSAYKGIQEIMGA